jgi:UDP-N-acetyl-D-mannosaminuronic acid dehydrogenase
MPLHVAEMTAQALQMHDRPIRDARIAVLGYAYLENSDDTRNSPAAALIQHLRAMGAEVVVHDPWVVSYQGKIVDSVQGCDAVVVTVGHQEYRTLNLQLLKHALRLPLLVDGRGLFDPHQVRSHGWFYYGVGRGMISDEGNMLDRPAL